MMDFSGSADLIVGVGTDILYVQRIAKTYARFGDKFLQRILGQLEQEVFHQRNARDGKRGMRYLATRFAAKEAFAKAIGLGMRYPMSWSLAQVVSSSMDKPSFALEQPLKSWYEERFGTAHLSMTDENDLVMAFVIIEKKKY